MNRMVSGCAIIGLVEGLTEFAAASYATDTALLAELRATWPLARPGRARLRQRQLRLELPGRRVERLEVIGELLARGFGCGVKTRELEDSPVVDDRQEDFVAMDAEVVDAGLRDRRRLAEEAGDARAGHLEREHLVDDRANRG